MQILDKETANRKAAGFLNKLAKKNKDDDYEENVIQENQVMMVGKSLYLFDSDSKVRQFVYRVAIHKRFDLLVIIIIAISSV